MSPIRSPIVINVTGVIYVIIIALWAAVLIPMWLRRHDQISEVRSTARFSDAMRSLSRADDPANEPVRRVPARTAAQRRTTVLIVLSALVATALGAALAGIAPRWMPIVTAVLLAAYLVAAALTAPQRAGVRARRQPTSSLRADEAVVDEAAAAKAQDVDDWETWNAWDDDDESWAPVPATVPTYVTAPRASAIPRPIDRTASGEWTGTAMVEAAQRMRTAEQAAADRQAAEMDAALADVAADARSQTAELPVITTQRAAGA